MTSAGKVLVKALLKWAYFIGEQVAAGVGDDELLFGFVGVGACGGGFGALDTVVSGCADSGGDFRADFALFGRGCCVVDQSELQSKRRVMIIQHSW